MQGAEPSSRKLKRDRLTPSHCEIPGCDWTYNFQRHRIVPGRDGGKYKLGNVIALCPNDHSLADVGLIPAEYLLQIVALRITSSAPETEQETELKEDVPSQNDSRAGHE